MMIPAVALMVFMPTLVAAQGALTTPKDALSNRLIEEYATSASVCMRSAVARALAVGEREADVIKGFAIEACGRPLAQFAVSRGRTEDQAKALVFRLAGEAIDTRDPAYGPLCRGQLARGKCDGPIR